MSCKVYVGGLPADARNEECAKSQLEDVFSRYGRLRKVWVARRPPGFAFLEYDDPRDAEDAVRGMDGRTVCGSRVRVEMSHADGRRRGPPVGGRGGGFGGGGSDRGYGGGRRSPSPRRSPRRSPSPRRSRSRSPRRYSRDSRDRSPRREGSRSPERRRSRSGSPGMNNGTAERPAARSRSRSPSR